LLSSLCVCVCVYCYQVQDNEEVEYTHLHNIYTVKKQTFILAFYC
jgi:hypothetical protein